MDESKGLKKEKSDQLFILYGSSTCEPVGLVLSRLIQSLFDLQVCTSGVDAKLYQIQMLLFAPAMGDMKQ